MAADPQPVEPPPRHLRGAGHGRGTGWQGRRMQSRVINRRGVLRDEPIQRKRWDGLIAQPALPRQ